MNLQEAKQALIIASEKRDVALETWPLENSFAISGHLADNTYAFEWAVYNQIIDEILNLYPELKNDH